MLDHEVQGIRLMGSPTLKRTVEFLDRVCGTYRVLSLGNENEEDLGITQSHVCIADQKAVSV